MRITKYNAICNLGENIDEVFKNALSGDNTHFIEKDGRRLGAVLKDNLPEIKESDYNLRCNRLALACLEPLGIEEHNPETLAVVAATTNSGVEEYETSRNPKHYQIGNPAEFIKEHANEQQTIDFEGSSIEGVARLYKGFGAENRPYCVQESIFFRGHSIQIRLKPEKIQK